MKTFQNFNEDIEQRRAQARERAIQASQNAKERVAAYQQAQQQKREEILAKKQREKEDEELVLRAKEEARKEMQDT